MFGSPSLLWSHGWKSTTHEGTITVVPSLRPARHTHATRREESKAQSSACATATLVLEKCGTPPGEATVLVLDECQQACGTGIVW